MLKWLRKMLGSPTDEPETPSEPKPQPPVKPQRPAKEPEAGKISVMDVVDRFLAEDPTVNPYGVFCLIESGATRLTSDEEVVQACAKIREHGRMFPLSPTLQTELRRSETLAFLRWHETAQVNREAYQNENTIRALLERFRSEHT